MKKHLRFPIMMGQSRNTLRTLAWAVMVVAFVNAAGCKKKGSSAADGSSALPAKVSAANAEVLPTECQAAIEAIRKAGQPVTPEELDRWYVKPAPGENAAEIYTKAFALMVLPDRKTPGLPFLGSGTLPSPSDSLPAAMKKAIEEVLAQNQPALDLLCQTQKFSSSRYPVDLTEGVKAKLAHLSGVKSATQLLSLRAMLAAEQGDSDSAVEATLAGLRLARSLEAEPVLISQLVDIAAQVIVKNSLERIVNRLALPNAHLQILIQVMREGEDSHGLTRAFIGERCLAIDLMKKTPQEIRALSLGTSFMPALQSDEYRRQPVFARDATTYLDLFASLIDALSQPLPHGLTAEKKFNAALAGAATEKLLFTSAMLPAYSGVIQKEAELLAHLRAAETVLALERYRLAHQDALPTSLDELAPVFLASVPVDPFTGGPLRFKPRLGKSYVVYSVGPDGQDDNGTPRNPRSTAPDASYDLPFQVRR